MSYCSVRIPVIFTRPGIANESEMRQISNYALIFGLDYALREILDAPPLRSDVATIRAANGHSTTLRFVLYDLIYSVSMYVSVALIEMAMSILFVVKTNIIIICGRVNDSIFSCNKYVKS